MFRIPEALSQTKNGLTFKVNNDGSVTVIGTTTDTTTIDLELESPVVLNGTYTFSVKRTGTGGASDQQWILYKGTLENKQSLGLNPGLNGNVTNTVEATATILRVFTANAKTINCTIYPILEEGSTVTDWDVAETHTTPNPSYEEPIKSSGDNGSITEKISNSDNTEIQTYTMPVQQPMRSIGDVRDIFFKNTVDSPYYDENLVENGWYERHYIGRKIFDGTETILNEASLSDVNRYIFSINGVKSGNALSNYYKYLANYTSNTEHFYTGNNQIIVFHSNTITSGTNYKTWLAEQYANGTPMYIDYQLAEPLDLPCTQEQIEVLKNRPSTYKTETNVNSEDEIEAYIDAEYVIDLKTYIDNN